MLSRLIQLAKDVSKGKPLKLRSTHWPHTRAEFLKTHSICAYCGSPLDGEVHHIKPFHLYPELELDQKNLIRLCEAKTGPNGCHLKHGHLGNWKKFNPKIKAECKFK